jgi:hypothetical protein
MRQPEALGDVWGAPSTANAASATIAGAMNEATSDCARVVVKRSAVATTTSITGGTKRTSGKRNGLPDESARVAARTRNATDAAAATNTATPSAVRFDQPPCSSPSIVDHASRKPQYGHVVADDADTITFDFAPQFLHVIGT